MATSYTISNLDAKLKSYLSANKDELISKAVFNSKTSRMLNLQTGVKNPTAIVRLDSSVTLADGTTCGFSATGEDVFTNRKLVPSFIKVNKQFCPKDFLNTWKASDVKIAATGQEDNMPFEEAILKANLDQLGSIVEKLIWQGDTTNGTGNMALADGLYTQMDADITNTVIPAANVIAKGSDDIWTRVQKLWLALDPAMADKATILMSISNFKQMLIDLTNSNICNIFEEIQEGEYWISMPGAAGTTIRGIEGLEGLDVIIATPMDNLYYGVDLENDSEEVDLFWSPDDRVFKMVIEFVVATNYAIPEYIYVNR